ncbi:MAG: 30S ribosomal protein S17 [Candidatus Omnitrophota bacterium]
MKKLKTKGKVLEGAVLSAKMKKTIVVTVTQKAIQNMYNRLVISRKKYKVHDEENKAKAGDRVKIVESRPYSKEKRFCLLEILK